jgi:cephalosporin hydroxylase
VNDVATQRPPPVTFDIHASGLEYWAARLGQHVSDSYAGVPIAKFPEDLRVYEHLLWEAAPTVVIELGTQYGGSTLWFRDRLRTLAEYGRVRDPLVVTVDVDLSLARETFGAAGHDLAGIVLVEGDILDPALPARIAEHVPAESACLVVEDTAHVYETTSAALRGFAPFVPAGGYFVVEDTCLDIDELRLDEEWPRGTLAALRDWFETPGAASFTIRRERETYGLTCHPYGFLQRVA